MIYFILYFSEIDAEAVETDGGDSNDAESSSDSEDDIYSDSSLAEEASESM